jgi:hypothetical protein
MGGWKKRLEKPVAFLFLLCTKARGSLKEETLGKALNIRWEN